MAGYTLGLNTYDGEAKPRVGFFTDTSVCIGCKACEVACKEWNQVPEDGLNFTGWSYDNTQGLSADTWRHVAFVEQGESVHGSAGENRFADSPGVGSAGRSPEAVAAGVDVEGPAGMRWLMASDVCKHCTSAACLEVCPTGALFRTEYGTVVVQADVCNGCGYCVPACPFGVISRRESDGRAWKCTLCYDRLKVDEQPACAHACPTSSIQFGELGDLRERAEARVEELHAAGDTSARLYLHDDEDGIEGAGAFFLLLDEPEVYGLPPDPVSTTRDLPGMWRAAAVAGGAIVAGIAFAFAGGRR